MRFAHIIIAVFGLLCLVGGTAAATTIDDLELGDCWMGEKWDKESLKGRTVLIEFWGYN
jgi:hypothetical protein